MSQPNVVIVKYEDLLKDSEGELRRVVNSLKLDVDCEHIPRIVSNQSFKKKKEDFQRRGDVKNRQFLRSGKEGGWKNYLYPNTVEQIEIKHIVIMNKLGYL